jgi:uncharacterized protein CbrC (UPF0167 family)
MDLPTFRYHPDPIASGSIVQSDAQCVCCNARRGFIYAGPSYWLDHVEEEDLLCPWCIADGSAHKKFDASFAEPAYFPKNIAQDIIEEVCHRTPAFNSWQAEQWLTCCGDAANFLAPVGYAEIRARYPQFEGALMAYMLNERRMSGEAATRLLGVLDRDHGPTAYLFSCRHCDNKPVYIDWF